MSWRIRTVLVAAASVSLLVSSGCGASKNTPAEGVTGKVTLNSAPVSGELVFVTSDGSKLPTGIAPDGSYTVANLPKGELKILVMSNAPVNVMLPKGAEPPAALQNAGTPPPAKYAKLNNGLKINVTGGFQTHDIELTP